MIDLIPGTAHYHDIANDRDPPAECSADYKNLFQYLLDQSFEDQRSNCSRMLSTDVEWHLRENGTENGNEKPEKR